MVVAERVIIDVPMLFRMSVADVEEAYGPGLFRSDVTPGAMPHFPQGGEERTYPMPYPFDVYFDDTGRVAGVIFHRPPRNCVDPQAYLRQFGFDVLPPPDEESLSRMTWHSVDHCWIDLFFEVRQNQRMQRNFGLNIWRR